MWVIDKYNMKSSNFGRSFFFFNIHSFSDLHDNAVNETLSHWMCVSLCFQVIMGRVWMPSSCLQPATFLTATAMTTHTSWRISSCKIHSCLLRDSFTVACCIINLFITIFQHTVYVTVQSVSELVYYVLRYVVSSLELLVAEDYMIVYLNGATPRRKMPGISWLKRCYQMIDRK